MNLAKNNYLLAIFLFCASGSAFALQAPNTLLKEQINSLGLDSETLASHVNVVNNSLGLSTGDLPVSGYQQVELIGGGFSTGLNVGCEGVGLPNIASKLSSQLNGLLGNLEELALGIAINQLIFSNPTLYELIQDMKESLQFNLKLNVASCQSLRALADKHREAVSKAQDKCLTDGNDAEYCNDGNNIKSYAEDVIDNLGKVTGNINDAEVGNTPPANPNGPAGNGTGTGRSLSGNLNEAIKAQAALPNDVAENFDALMPARIYEGNGKIKTEARKYTLEYILDKKTGEIVKLLNEATENISKGKSFKSELDEINSISHGGNITRTTILELATIRSGEDKPVNYAIAASNLARSIALQHTLWIGNSVIMAVSNAETSGELAAKMTPEAKEQYKASNEMLEREMKSLLNIRTAQKLHVDVLDDITVLSSKTRARKIKGQ